ncbi:replication initiation protein [Clostridium tagluense]|uniref:replication initiation protein n=1 Tax=Clostridium tagluense TaxID=360422 RepID=UPI001C0CFC98|nr:RepB family plasmid replication initiator protein [Clostridium tagluense]MBU3130441.1 RepB family plasmid replication initiator protein [Clostridium tagluense]
MNKNLEAIRPNGLIEARHELTSKENNIIDLVLNTIKDDNKYKYEIDIEKYKKVYILGSTNVYRDLKNTTNELFEKHNKFSIKDKLTGRERKFVWFSMLEYIPNEGKIMFEVGDTLKTMMLEMKKRIYYKIEYPINFKSLYSKRIYYMLKSFEDTGWRIDKIEDLKYKLNCPETYKNFAIFKLKVLDMAQKEINNASDINFAYEPIKTGRKVTSIKFTITTNKARNEMAATSAKIEKYPQQNIEDIKLVKTIIHENIKDIEASKILSSAKGDIEKIKEKYNVVSQLNDVKNVVGTVITAIKEDWSLPKGKTKVGSFNDYEQRTYDMVDLEKKLLGWDNNNVAR